MLNFKTIIVADGEIPAPQFWPSFNQAQLICTDGAALKLQRLGVIPNIIIGDLDTLLSHYPSTTLLQLQFPSSQIIKIDNQDTTDFEKSLIYSTKHLSFPVLCLGIFGQALDHSLHNLCLFSNYSLRKNISLPANTVLNSINIMWLHEFSGTIQWGFLLPPKCCITTKPNQTISFFPMPEATLSSQGLKWELRNKHLSQNGFNSVRNKTADTTLMIDTNGLCFAILTQSDTPHIQVLA